MECAPIGVMLSGHQKFQSTHPVWGATGDGGAERKAMRISIHAPRVGCDQRLGASTNSFLYFNPRTPRGVRRFARIWVSSPPIFQSTHPAWGATWCAQYNRLCDFISIHAPRVGCDLAHRLRRPDIRHFNPRTPRGVRHSAPSNWRDKLHISIHAPRVGCDLPCAMISVVCCNFNPRTPRGVRRVSYGYIKFHTPFQSTHPAWGATFARLCDHLCVVISIHAPRVGCDASRRCYFFSRRISIHAPRVGCDSFRMRSCV